MVAAVLLTVVLDRAVFRSPAASGTDGARERQMTLPLAYVSVAALLLFLVSVVPTVAFFKAAYQIQVTSDVKFTQLQLARALQNRWWRLAGESKDDGGKPRKEILDARWNNQQDLHYDAPETGLDLGVAAPSPAGAAVRLPWFEKILPHYSEASVNTRELLHDRSADDQWEWTREGPKLHLTMRAGDPVPSFTITSRLPSPFRAFAADAYRPPAVVTIAYAILQGPESEAWSHILSTFVWVNGSQINADVRGVTLSGFLRAYEDSVPSAGGRMSWLKRLLQRIYLATGFGNYFEQMADSRVVNRTIVAEVQGDPYLETWITGLGLVGSGRDQVLDEIGERADEYYTALWNACRPSEQLLLM